MLIDHHCHLDFPQFSGQRDEIIARAEASGVQVLVTISTKIRSINTILEIAEAYENVFCSVGTHPHYADDELEIQTSEILALSQHPKVVAIGESGLDFFYKKSSYENQEISFRRHISVARKTGLPIEIHVRNADDHAACILREEYAKGPFKAILHCFTGSQELAKCAIDLGLCISFSGIITFKNSTELKIIAAKVPLNQLLVETDSPYLAPVPHRGKVNEPSFVRHTAQILAEVKGVSFDELANATTDNFYRLFKKVQR
ncbi:MAG: putative metal-dependent hydrolase YcfH [Hyphomicrobiaceae bacterium hypho_1]